MYVCMYMHFHSWTHIHGCFFRLCGYLRPSTISSWVSTSYVGYVCAVHVRIKHFLNIDTEWYRYCVGNNYVSMASKCQTNDSCSFLKAPEFVDKIEPGGSQFHNSCFYLFLRCFWMLLKHVGRWTSGKWLPENISKSKLDTPNHRWFIMISWCARKIAFILPRSHPSLAAALLSYGNFMVMLKETFHSSFCWLVGQGHPSEKYESVNWDDNRNPILMGK